MIEVRWFIWLEEKVQGPFDSQGIIKTVEDHGIQEQAHIWWRGQSEWVPYRVWFDEYKDTDIYGSYADNWELISEDESLGTMPYHEVVQILANHSKELERFKVRRNQSKDWKTIFEVKELIESLNLSRRMHPRAPLMGVARLNTGNVRVTARMTTISERGFGIKIEGYLEVGREYFVEIESPNLSDRLMVMAEILYSDKTGYVGATFIGLDSKSRLAIIEFVNKFVAAQKVAGDLIGRDSA